MVGSSLLTTPLKEAKLDVLWVLTGPKAGDNAQVLKAAEATGLPFAVKRIAFRPGQDIAKPAVSPSLDAVDVAGSDSLSAPWPSVVLAIGRQLSCIALWIKKQSGGTTRIVLFNAPKGHAAGFDLVVLPPYYRGSSAPNVLGIRAPLIGIEPARLEMARETFRTEVGALPRPLHVLLVGGDMGLRKLDGSFLAGVVRQMKDGFAARGTIYAATSRRTAPEAVAALEAELDPQDRLYRWGEAGSVNPYLGLLAHGDTFTVTADSLSMLMEVARLAKPLIVAEPPPPQGLKSLTARIAGLLRPRDLGGAVRMLYDGGHAVPLGQSPRPVLQPLPDDTPLVAARIRELAGAGN